MGPPHAEGGSGMFPLDQDTLLILKVFVFLTCVCFWLKLGVDALLRRYGIGRHFSERRHL